SPNTPGLRNLQGRAQMREVVVRAKAARQGTAGAGRLPPLLFKVGPDLDGEAIRDIAEVAVAEKIDGLIVGNTTLDRPASLKSAQRGETGGLSGQPLLGKANACLAEMYRAVDGRLPIIGCGGVANGAHAYAKIRAGASLVQLYSALVYHGPGLVVSIRRELAARLRADGFKSVADAVGADFR
ncbi:MAG: quinone-dependent dihydroorotate dehydrogenase, partial [Burkholderiales bacterium]